jgi:hypothetical protein
LRQFHEGQKTLILGCQRPTTANKQVGGAAAAGGGADSFGLDLAAFITPRLILPKGY